MNIIKAHRPCCYGNHDWKQVTEAKVVTIDRELMMLIHWVCMDCFAIAQYKEKAP